MDSLIVLFVICLSGAAFADSRPPCDQGWISNNFNCYLFNTMKSVTRDAANLECYRNDASLLRLTSQDQLTWLQTQFKQFPSSGYWTDLNDNPKVAADRLGTGVWKWGSYQYADMSLVSWNQSPANDGQSKCAGVNIKGTIADIKCSARQGYICKYAQDPQNPGCVTSWLIGSTACYWFSNTSDPSQLKSWNDAKTVCEGKGNNAKLLVISDQNDVDFLTNELPFIAQNTKTHWIGLQSTTVGQWSWYTGDTFNAGLVKWQKEPDNVAGIENCGILRMTGKFSDRDCSSNANFICFKPHYFSMSTSNLGCGSWIRAGHLCYGFMTYAQKKTWADARSYCQSMSSDLIKIDSFDKRSWLMEQLQDPGKNRMFWIGLNDQQTEGTYKWADGTLANSSYLNWNQEPNDYKGFEDCAVIYTTGQYNDVACTINSAAICELDGISPCPSGWKANGGNCYLFTPYANVSQLYNQLEATNYCATFAPNSNTVGALLSVDSQDEKAFIKAQVKSMSDNIYGWYTSLNDKASEGFWAFASGPLLDGTLVDWTGEPSTIPGDNCGLVGYGGNMHERSCTRKLPFICERYATGYSGKGNRQEINIVAGLVLLVVTFLLK